MRPGCYRLESTADGTSLYLGETSTEECLLVFAPEDSVAIAEFGATVRGGAWFDRSDLPPIANVADLLRFLQMREDLSLIDFSANVGAIALSTHDDAEAEIVFPDPLQSLAFLRQALDPTIAERVVTALLGNEGKYVVIGETVQAFETFDAYVAATAPRR